MSFTKKLITSAVVGSLAGVVANLFVKRKTKSSIELGRPVEKIEDTRFQSVKDDSHFFV